jgi:hypothetical protein
MAAGGILLSFYHAVKILRLLELRFTAGPPLPVQPNASQSTVVQYIWLNAIGLKIALL